MEFEILYALQKLHNQVLDQLMISITHLGDGAILWIEVGIVLLFFRKTRRCGILMLISLYLCMLIGDNYLKPFFARPRPCWLDPLVQVPIRRPHSFSFPSGHTYDAFACATMIYYHHKREGIVALILAGLIAFSRMYLFVHFPTDILGGIVFGVSVAFSVNAVYYLLHKGVHYIWRKHWINLNLRQK